jgi:transposase
MAENQERPEPLTSSQHSDRYRGGRGKQHFPSHLERHIIYMEEPDQTCACRCGGAAIGYDTVETLQVKPATFFVEVHKYPKCRCHVDGKIKSTRFAPRLFSHTCATNALLAHTITMRFGWQIPLYRQEAMLMSQGIELRRSTLVRWQNRVAIEALLPLVELMEVELKKTGARLFMDETTLQQLQPGKGKTRTSYLYALLRDDRSFGDREPLIVLYFHRPTRKMKEIDEILLGFSGIVQTDAYAGYGRIGKVGTVFEDSIWAKCWSHTRRNLTDEHEFNKTEDAARIVSLIDELYRVERSVRGQPPAVRRAFRLKYSVPILERLKVVLSDCANRHMRRSGMGKAIDYAFKHWEELVRFVDDGRIDLDTNAVERMFKPIILLRKSALFVGSDSGGHTWAILASIIETCKLNGVNVEPNLTWVLDQITAKLPRSKYNELLPWNAPEEFLVDR